MAKVRIGCSGWAYDHWAGAFYPPGLTAKRRLGWYATRFSTAEINASFYGLPRPATVETWASQVPDGFCFAWKVSRFITHNKKLRDCKASVDLVFGRMSGLGAKQGPALVQLPPMLKRDDERLAQFAGWLPKDRRIAVEFRHPSWYEPAVFELLRAHSLAVCVSDHADAPAPALATTDFVYVRLHGPRGAYAGRYEDRALATWAERIADWDREGRDVYVYFDNDVGGAAPADAAGLEARLGLTARRGRR
jgi:uncharacterized protein YecE (DUF72 family)